MLGDEINRALGRNARTESPRNGDRIVTLQGRIDDGRINGRIPLTEGREFQSRLDAIRGDYLRMTEGGKYATSDERTDISRRLDSLETDINGSGRIIRKFDSDCMITAGWCEMNKPAVYLNQTDWQLLIHFVGQRY